MSVTAWKAGLAQRVPIGVAGDEARNSPPRRLDRALHLPGIVPLEGIVNGRGEQPQAEWRQGDRDTGPGDSRGMVRVSDYPNLALLCRGIKSPYITRRIAFALYERKWRMVDVASAPEQERALIDNLAREFGQGVINA